MTSRAPTGPIKLMSPTSRQLAASWCMSAPDGITVTFREANRTQEQNAAMWAKLQDVSEQVVWYGAKLSADDWKDVFSASLRKARVVPTIDGDGFVPLGMRTSKMTKAEMGALLDLIDAFAAQHGVAWSAPDYMEAMRA